MATKSFRFALGSPATPLSGLWRIWTHEDELHLAVRATHEDVSLTAYPTGRWRIAVGAAVSRWSRPKEFRPGWTRGPDLVLPYTAVPIQSPATDPYSAEPVTWLSPPTPGHLARLTLLFASPRAEESSWRPPDTTSTQSITALPFRTAGTIHLCRLDEPLAPEDRPDPVTEVRGRPAEPNPVRTGFEVIVSADQAGRPSLRESPIG